MEKFGKVCTKIFLFALAALLLLCAAVFCTPSSNTARAEDSITVIKAPVSNLEGNAYAGVSAVRLFDSNNNEFYIPESYFLCSPSMAIKDRIFNVTYCNMSFLLRNEDFSLYELPATTQINLSEGEVLFPDMRLALKNEETSLLSQVAESDGIVKYVPKKTINNEYTVKLLGYNEDGREIFVCATYNGDSDCGFIPADELEEFAVPYQQRAQAERAALLAAKEKPTAPNGSITPPNTSVALRIVLIIGIAVPAILVVLLLFKPSKNERRYAKNSVRNDRGRDGIDYDDPRNDRRRDRRYDDEYRNSRERDYDRDRDYDRNRGYDRRYDDRGGDYDGRDRRYDRDYDNRR